MTKSDNELKNGRSERAAGNRKKTEKKKKKNQQNAAAQNDTQQNASQKNSSKQNSSKQNSSRQNSSRQNSSKQDAPKQGAQKKNAPKKGVSERNDFSWNTGSKNAFHETSESGKKKSGRRSGGSNRGGKRRNGSSKPAKRMAEIREMELGNSRYRDYREDEMLSDEQFRNDYDDVMAEISAAEAKAEGKTFSAQTFEAVGLFRRKVMDTFGSIIAERSNSEAKETKENTSIYFPGSGAFSGGKIRIIMLGGLEQIGMNITAFESDTSIVVVDCGMSFPDESMPGIDLVIPDITYLTEHQDKLRGFFITHGHEDHIGALPYVLRELNVPVYCTRLTRALIELKLKEAGLLESAKLNTVKFGDVVNAGDFAMEFIKTNHSIQDAAAIAIHSPAGTILHTGDFKVDYTPVFGDAIDLQRFAELGKQGVLALLCDSTNAIRPGFTMSERTVGRTFENIFAEYQDKRIVVATFASNVDRVQQVITVAEKYGRKVVIDGRSMVNVIGAASELGYLTIREGTLIDISEIRNYPDSKIVLVVTGSQGEPMAALSRMAQGLHKKVYLSSNDVIVLSSTPIPGNEKAVSKVINDLSRRHTKVIYQDTHVSGHACAEDIKLIYSLVRPRYAIPVHGEFRHRLAQRELALAVGVPKENVLMADTGDVIDICEDYCTISDKVQAGPVLVDGLGVGDVGNIVLRDRQSLAQNGIIIVTIALEGATGEVLGGPDIVTRGFVYVRENEDLIEEARQVVLDALESCTRSGCDDWAHIKNVIKDGLSDFIWRRMKRNPMILPIITEI